MFKNYSQGVLTARDAWCYSASKSLVERNINSMIEFYNSERVRYNKASDHEKLDVAKFIDSDSTRISWTRALKKDLGKNKTLAFSEGEALISTYRPFSKQWMYYGRRLNEMVYQMPQIFPNAKAENRVICVTGIGATAGFSALIVHAVPNFHTLDSGQCFPLKLYKKIETSRDDDLFEGSGNPQYRVQDGISDQALTHFQTAYPGETISKEDLFYYLYGILHSEDYRTKYKNNLMKQLPRLPVVTDVEDFRAFLAAGYALAELHLGYETVDPWPVTINDGKGLPDGVEPERLYRVEKMKFGGGHGAKKDRTKIVYNPYITISDIPLEAYNYVVNGKPAIQWVIERQNVKTDKASRLVNDTNHYAIETMGNPAYPMELLRRIIRVSMETLEIVRDLPPLQA